MQIREFISVLLDMRENSMLQVNVCELMDRFSITQNNFNAKKHIPASERISGTGIVKFYLIDKKFGFVKADNPTLGDVFVHANNLDDEDIVLQPGTPVSFEAESSPKGLRAITLSLLEVQNAKTEEDSLCSESSSKHGQL